MHAVRHPALGQYFDPGYVDVHTPYTSYGEPFPEYSGGYTTGQQIVGSASNVLASGVASGQPLDITLVQTGGAAATTAVGATASASTAAIAIPVIGAAVAAVSFWLMRNRIENVRKEKATEVVNAAEQKMKENLQAYLTGPRTVSSQRQALANFDALWGYIVRGCSAVGGEAGKRCIEERQRGGSAPWCPTGTGCDYFTLYRDPIANDRPVPDGQNLMIDPVTGEVLTASGSPLLPILLMGAGVFLLLFRKKEDED